MTNVCRGEKKLGDIANFLEEPPRPHGEDVAGREEPSAPRLADFPTADADKGDLSPVLTSLPVSASAAPRRQQAELCSSEL